MAMLERLGGGRTEITSLTVQTKQWNTPTAGEMEGNGFRSGARSEEPKLKGQALSHQAETTTTDGDAGSRRADLNPFFVATLMGLPMDWLTHSTSGVTASCHKQLQKPSDNSAHERDGS